MLMPGCGGRANNEKVKFILYTTSCVCFYTLMATNLSIDETLLKAALKIGHFKSKKETVNNALLEFIQKRKQVDLLDLFGQIEYYDDYDYKKIRSSK